jgi:hypothetical protein
MGKPVFPPQGVGAPVLFLGSSQCHSDCTGCLAALGLTAEAAVSTWVVVSTGSIYFLLLFSQENVCGYECGEDYRDYAVHGKEGGVEFGEIVGLDQRMLVEQEHGYGNYTNCGEFA